jgi:glycosyltransferase involved in cell wall biosynthesis
VVYDISSLGLGHADRVHRTGIFRVVERLAQELLAMDECEVAFSALHSAEFFAHTANYLAASAVLPGQRLARTQPGLGLVRRLVNAHAARAGGPGAPVTTKAYRRGLLHGRQAMEAVLNAVAPARAPEADVFHSPRFALPAPARTGAAARFMTVHDLIPILVPETVSPAATREMRAILASLRPEDWVFAVSERTRQDLCEYRPDLDPARIIVTYWAADPAVFHPVEDPAALDRVRARYGIGGAPYLLSLNTLDPRKNMDRAVRAFARMAAQERISDLCFVLVGSRGTNVDLLGRMAREAGISPARVVLTGYVPDEDLAALYSGALAFVYPSLYEGFGLPPLEAMQCGVPVIASNTSSLPEVVGDAGILVHPTDEDALGGAMLHVYRDGAQRERMRERSLARAAGFSWARCARHTVDGYRAAMAAR